MIEAGGKYSWSALFGPHKPGVSVLVKKKTCARRKVERRGEREGGGRDRARTLSEAARQEEKGCC